MMWRAVCTCVLAVLAWTNPVLGQGNACPPDAPGIVRQTLPPVATVVKKINPANGQETIGFQFSRFNSMNGLRRLLAVELRVEGTTDPSGAIGNPSVNPLNFSLQFTTTVIGVAQQLEFFETANCDFSYQRTLTPRDGDQCAGTDSFSIPADDLCAFDECGQVATGTPELRAMFVAPGPPIEGEVDVTANFVLQGAFLPLACEDFLASYVGTAQLAYLFEELGACCLSTPQNGGLCVVLTRTDCEMQGGSFAGELVSCETAVCGACCLASSCGVEPDLGCRVLPVATCAQLGGTHAGLNVTCAVADCRACCVPVTGGFGADCQYVPLMTCMTAKRAGGLGGIPSEPGVCCSPGLCVGRCCFADGTCAVTTEAQCNPVPGVREFYPNLNDCPEFGPEPPCAGACCLPAGGCIRTTADDCNSRGGFYTPFGRCGVDDEGTGPIVECGSCCLPELDPIYGLCRVATRQCCEAPRDQACHALGNGLAGVFTAGVLCDQAGCGACCLAAEEQCQVRPQGQCLTPNVFAGVGVPCTGSLCTGACCLPNGMCMEGLTQSLCESQGGFFNGLLVTCATVDCTGACCLPNGECVGNQTEASCLALSGFWNGGRSNCAMVDCTGACCLPNGECLAGQTQATCTTLSGFWNGGRTSCATVDCTGACCLPDGTCIGGQTQATCEAEPNHGFWNGGRTSCATVDCTGACCLPNGTCIEGVTQATCEGPNNGFWNGGRSDCATVDCTGACCLPNGTCIGGQTQASCEATPNGGFWNGGRTSCATVDCTGACCLTDGTCIGGQTQATCEAGPNNGFWNGSRTSCATVDCTGACCLPNGTCIGGQTQASCEATPNSGFWNGGRTSCATVDCTGACCLPNGTCIGGQTQASCEATPNNGFWNGGRTSCATVDCTGACCLPTGECLAGQTEATCTTLSGVWNGGRTDCASVDCTGACCLPNGECLAGQTQATCTTLSGFWNGTRSDCRTVDCTGACCLPDGTCIGGQTQATCESGPNNGFWNGGRSSCATVDCTGACCLPDGTCIGGQTQATCESGPNNGFWNGGRSSCATVDCTGACCLPNGTCIGGLTQATCEAQSGFWNGGRTDCASVDCTGACCLPNGTCIGNQTQATCTSQSGFWNGGRTSCASVNCAGACCLPNGTCIGGQTQATCEGGPNNGFWNGSRTECATVDCTGACCLPNGTCIGSQTQATCTGQSGFWNGGRTSCASVDCTGACCLPNGTCIGSQTQATCTSQSGFWNGGRSSCASVDCTGACCLPNGTCIGSQTQASCEATPNSGFWNGGRTDCRTVDCTGACCLPNGSCIDGQTQTSCVSTPNSGSWNGGRTSCATLPPGTCLWACCAAGSSGCQLTTLAECQATGDQYFGSSLLKCEEVNGGEGCPGSCCLPGGSCQELTQAACIQAGGCFEGIGTRCESTICTGSCCTIVGDIESCAVLTRCECEAQPGFVSFKRGEECGPDTCQTPRPCCLPTGACEVLTPFMCLQGGGVSGQRETSCADADCAPCCFDITSLSDDRCRVLPRAACNSVGGYAGASGLSCAHAQCVTCCIMEEGPCVYRPLADCSGPGARSLGTDVLCDPDICSRGLCYWENGDADGVNAIVSETNTVVPASEAADDFIVPAGRVLLADSLCACLVTNDLPRWIGNTYNTPDAILQFREDCNGVPGNILSTHVNPSYEVLGNAPFGAPGQWKYVKFCFDGLGEQFAGGIEEARYWVSVIGVGNNRPGERYFWATSKTEPSTKVQGVQGHMRSGWVEGFGDWNEIDNGNGACHDLCFELCGELCEVVCDNRPYALDCGLKMLNTTFFGTKAADNFQIGPCTSAEICTIEVYIATNCVPSRGRLELFRNECDTPENLLYAFSNPEVRTILNQEGQPITFMSPVSGLMLTTYCLRWRFAEGQVFLPGEQNYWIAWYLEGTGVVTEEAYVLCKQLAECHIKITQAKFLSAPFAVSTWEDVGNILNTPRDMAFRVLGRLNRAAPAGAPWTSPQDAPGAGVASGQSLTPAPADLSVSDVLEVLRQLQNAPPAAAAGTDAMER